MIEAELTLLIFSLLLGFTIGVGAILVIAEIIVKYNERKDNE